MTTNSFGINTRSSPQLRWLVDMLQFMSIDAVSVPKEYREQVIQTKRLLSADTSGLVNTILDFGISAALVDYTLEVNDDTLKTVLEEWFENINSDLRGRIPTGITALAQEYFKERWKGSSHLVLMTKWKNVDGWDLPTSMWFLDGEDIVVRHTSNDGINRIGDEQYRLLINPQKKKSIPIATTKDELFFVQKPFEQWSTLLPTPFLIRRGVFRNMKFYDILTGKGEHVVQKAVEYMMIMKKGTEKLAATGDDKFIYSHDDLNAVKEDFSRFLAERRTAPAIRTPSYITGFDTEMEHLIPEYERVLKPSLYMAVERRLLAGLGMIDILESTGSTRKESLLNPKPLKHEVECGIKDFAQLLTDVLKTVIERNRGRHPKKMALKTVVRTSPTTAFLGDKVKQLIRSSYDRGLISKQTTVELVPEVKYEVEVSRREQETGRGEDETMFPPIIQNQEGVSDDDVPDDRKPNTPDAKNFNQAICEHCGEDLDPTDLEEAFELDETFNCPSCEGVVDIEAKTHGKPVDPRNRKKKSPYQTGSDTPKDYEEAAWKTNADLPKGVKVLLSVAQTIWRKTANNALKTNDEQTASRIAWSAVKKSYKKVKGKWVKREFGAIKYASEGELPQEVLSSLSAELLPVYLQVFNDEFVKHDNENLAYKITWAVIEKLATKDQDGVWHRKADKVLKAMITKEQLTTGNDDVVSQSTQKYILEILKQSTELELSQKKLKLLDRLLKTKDEDENIQG